MYVDPGYFNMWLGGGMHATECPSSCSKWHFFKNNDGKTPMIVNKLAYQNKSGKNKANYIFSKFFPHVSLETFTS